MNIKVLLIVLFCNLGSIWADVNKTKVSKQQDDEIFFQKPFYLCHMYADDCDVYLRIKKRTLELAKLSFVSENERVFRINSIVACKRNDKNQTNLIDCPPMQEVFATNETREWNENDYLMFKINIYARLFGKARLLPLLDGHQIFIEATNQTKSALMVMMQPNRFVDQLLTIWVYIFQTIMSLIMGLLLDPNTILKIIKMPVAVIFGVSCQYILMPLVIYHLLFDSIIFYPVYI